MELLQKMVSGTPQFVRCLKPNDSRSPKHFDSTKILKQLRYTGVLETIRIRQNGFSHRLTFEEFLKRWVCVFSLIFLVTHRYPDNDKTMYHHSFTRFVTLQVQFPRIQLRWRSKTEPWYLPIVAFKTQNGWMGSWKVQGLFKVLPCGSVVQNLWGTGSYTQNSITRYF